MARPYTRQSLYWNLLPAGENKPTRAAPSALLINHNGILSHTFAMSHVSILALVLPFTFAKLVAKYTNVNLQRITKLAQELFI